MNKKTLAILGVVFVVAGFILAPVLCGPVTSDEYTMSFEVDAFAPVLATFIAFVLAAVCTCSFIKAVAQENNAVVNPLMIGLGMGAFGLFYSLMVVYKDAASVLNNFFNTWGIEEDKMAAIMPEAAAEFNMIASNYSKLMFVAVAVIAFGVYRVAKAIKAE